MFFNRLWASTCIFVGSLGCAPSALQVQARAADGVAKTINGLTRVAEQEYEASQREAKDDACEQNPDACHELAVKAVSEIRQKWAPVWDLHDALRVAHSTWVESLTLAGLSDDTGPRPEWWSMADDVYQLLTELLDILPKVGLDSIPIPPELRALLKDQEP